MTQSPQQSMELTEIGHYTILSAIGRGGMGLVYRARDTRLDRQVAIKCLRSELFEAHYRERFKREALLLAKLNHPHIVQIYDYLETETQLALVMEYVDGQNLQQHLRENIVSLAQRMQWLTQIAQGLAVAHDTGIIHRDLKAENILINKHKLAKITDLGIAKSQDFNATLTDHVTGSYASMSPEQAMGEELDSRSDLFSFGILAYQLLCGVHPFGDTQNKLQLMQRIISHPPTPPSKNNPDLPPEVVELLGQLLSKNPDKRPANTHWVAAQCEKLYQLIALNSVADLDNTQVLSPTHTSQSGIRRTNTKHTQEHPTFETDAEKNKSLFAQNLKIYIRNNSISVALMGLAVLICIGTLIWQLQPKQPKYVAVLPPNLTANGMQESQQELVKGAVYDAIQQSVLQLDGYYLIPQNEISDINAANNKEGIETVRRATAADELITTDIQCKIEACTITLSRLTPEGKKQESRLRVQDTKTVDVLIDNYLSVATIVQSNVGGLYSEDVANVFDKIDEKEYAKFLEANRDYINKGAREETLSELDKLSVNTKILPAVQTLYTNVALDIHSGSKNTQFLEKTNEVLNLTKNKSTNIPYLHNIFYLQIAKEKYSDAEITLVHIKNLNHSNSEYDELYAYLKMAMKDYKLAIERYKKVFSIKPTANNLYFISIAYWYSGDTTQAKLYIKKSLDLSPKLSKSLTLFGAINLLEGNIEQAKKSFRLAIEQAPNDTMSLSNLGLCYLLLQDYKQAFEYFDRAYKLSPQNTIFTLNKADAKNLGGDIIESEALYKNVIDLAKTRSETSETLQHVAQAYAHLGKYSEALTTLHQLEKMDYQNIETTYTASLVHALAKNNTSAVLSIDNALKNGMNKIWFNFSWFNSLCSDAKFVEIMLTYGEPERCTLH